MKKKVLIACEYSGTVRDAFSKLGFDATSCDLLPSDTNGKHYQGSVLDIINDNWDLMIAHPPCTYITNSGVHWLHKDKARWKLLEEACEFFSILLNSNIKHICIENPIPHKHATLHPKFPIGKYIQKIQPYQFGHMETKATCFWLKNLPFLEPVTDLKEKTMRLPKKQRQRIHYLGPTKNRAKIRSKTFQGIADAMASQWGSYILKKEIKNYSQLKLW